MYDSDPMLTFRNRNWFKERPYSAVAQAKAKKTKTDSFEVAKRARMNEEKDFIANLELEGAAKYFYLQGYGADEYTRNPYNYTNMLAYHAWEAGHYDKYGR